MHMPQITSLLRSYWRSEPCKKGFKKEKIYKKTHHKILSLHQIQLLCLLTIFEFSIFIELRCFVPSWRSALSLDPSVKTGLDTDLTSPMLRYIGKHLTCTMRKKLNIKFYIACLRKKKGFQTVICTGTSSLGAEEYFMASGCTGIMQDYHNCHTNLASQRSAAVRTLTCPIPLCFSIGVNSPIH